MGFWERGQAAATQRTLTMEAVVLTTEVEIHLGRAASTLLAAQTVSTALAARYVDEYTSHT